MEDAAFEGFYRARLAQVVRACALVTLDVGIAEEIAAEAFARLWPRWGRMESDDHAGGYVFKTAMHLCAKRAKRRRRETLQAVEHPGPDESARADDRHVVFSALGTLPLQQRQAVVLRDWAGFSTAEVAELIGTKESTVRVHLMRGRTSLRRTIAVEERNP